MVWGAARQTSITTDGPISTLRGTGNRLYHNTGKGFTDVTLMAGVAAGMWSASCAFGDIDNDGDADLYVTRYVDFTPENNKYCPFDKLTGVLPSPPVYPAARHPLPKQWRRDIHRYQPRLGDRRWWPETDLALFSATTTTTGWGGHLRRQRFNSQLSFHNKGAGVFEEVGFRAGVAVGTLAENRWQGWEPTWATSTEMDCWISSSRTLPSKLTICIATWERDYSTTSHFRVAWAMTLPFVGFGAAFLDYDNDMDLDLAIANGDVIDNVGVLRDQAKYKQLNLLLRNDGSGKFTEAGPESGPGFDLEEGRAARLQWEISITMETSIS